MANEALQVLKSGMVLDRVELNKLSAKNITEVIDVIRGNPLAPLKVVDNSVAFFTSANMIKLIEAGDPSYKLVAEQAGIDITEAEVAAIQLATKTRAEIVKKMTPPLPPYTFAKVPEGWTVAGYITIGKGDRGMVSRSRTNPNNDQVGYSVTLRQLRNLWAIASNRWLKDIGVAHADMTIHGYRRAARVEANFVQIACQRIQRYEIEQIALAQGWPFPVREEVAA